VKEHESFYDWESQYKINPKKAIRPKSEKKRVNNIGLLKEEFEIFLSNWKKKNNL